MSSSTSPPHPVLRQRPRSADAIIEHENQERRSSLKASVTPIHRTAGVVYNYHLNLNPSNHAADDEDEGDEECDDELQGRPPLCTTELEDAVRIHGTIELIDDLCTNKPPIPPRPPNINRSMQTVPSFKQLIFLSWRDVNVTIPLQEQAQRADGEPPSLWRRLSLATNLTIKNQNGTTVLSSPSHEHHSSPPASFHRDESTPAHLSPSPQHQYQSVSNSSPQASPPIAASSPPAADKAQPTSRRILQDITGSAHSGELLAVLGASGCGKTTLLNVLSGRMQSNVQHTVAGQISINGVDVLPSQLSSICAYVQQDDVLSSVLTAREHLTFSAQCRTPFRDESMESRNKRIAEKVNSVLEELGLTACADLYVGARAAGVGDGNTVTSTDSISSSQGPSFMGPFLASLLNSGNQRGLSGGEQRRVSIGIELVHDPALLFLDECVSGLDSFSALSIVRLLKKLATNQNRTIVFTIHSPSQLIFDVFDRVLLLSHDGRIAYSGPAKSAMSNFRALGYECPSRLNTADFLLKMLSVRNAGDRERVDALIAAQRDSQNAESDEMSANKSDFATQSELSISALASQVDYRPSTRTPYWTQVKLLLHRSATQLQRQPIFFIARLIQNLGLAFFVGLLFLNSGFDQRAIYARIAFLFFIVCNCSLLVLVGSVLLFTEERAQYQRERHAHLYRVSAYFHAKSLLEIPIQTVLSLALGVVGYFMVGLKNDASNALSFALALALLSLAANSIGLVLGAAAPTSTIAVLLAPLFVVPAMLCSSFFINIDSIPSYFWPLRAVSSHLYVFASIFANEFSGQTFYCRDVESKAIWIKSTLLQYCYLEDGQQVLDIFHLPMKDISYALAMFFTFLLFVFFRLVAWAILTIKDRQQTKEKFLMLPPWLKHRAQSWANRLKALQGR